jgi:hypothetical protein
MRQHASFRIDQGNSIAIVPSGGWATLAQIDAKLVRKDSHERCALDPRQGLDTAPRGVDVECEQRCATDTERTEDILIRRLVVAGQRDFIDAKARRDEQIVDVIGSRTQKPDVAAEPGDGRKEQRASKTGRDQRTAPADKEPPRAWRNGSVDALDAGDPLEPGRAMRSPLGRRRNVFRAAGRGRPVGAEVVCGGGALVFASTAGSRPCRRMNGRLRAMLLGCRRDRHRIVVVDDCKLLRPGRNRLRCPPPELPRAFPTSRLHIMKPIGPSPTAAAPAAAPHEKSTGRSRWRGADRAISTQP